MFDSDAGRDEASSRMTRRIFAAGAAALAVGVVATPALADAPPPFALDEVVGLSSRILVMRDGGVVADIEAPARAKPTQLDIVQHMG